MNRDDIWVAAFAAAFIREVTILDEYIEGVKDDQLKGMSTESAKVANAAVRAFDMVTPK